MRRKRKMLDVATLSMGVSHGLVHHGTQSIGAEHGMLRYRVGRIPVNGSFGRGRSLNLEAQAEVTSARSDRNALGLEFRHHERKWKRETRHLSSPTERYVHPRYAR